MLLYLLRFEVFTAVTMKNTVFWDVAPCRSSVNDVSEERISSMLFYSTYVESIQYISIPFLAFTSRYALKLKENY
jgi:hypothetical protein